MNTCSTRISQQCVPEGNGGAGRIKGVYLKRYFNSEQAEFFCDVGLVDLQEYIRAGKIGSFLSCAVLTKI